MVAPAARGRLSRTEVLVNEKQLAKLIRQTTAKAERTAAKRQPRVYDSTLPKRDETGDDAETTRLFKEMKKREF